MNLRDSLSVGPSVRSFLSWILLIALLAIIALHFGLVDVGQWTSDEFAILKFYRDKSWVAFWDRLTGWSPRPLSETLIWIYASVVNLAHKPFIGVFLGLLWMMLILTPLISLAQVRTKFYTDSQNLLLFLLLLPYELIPLFLLEHPPGALFYWPVGAAAYLTTVVALTLCFFQLAYNLAESACGRTVSSLSLILAAGSSETGAFFAIVFGCLSVVGTVVDRLAGAAHERKYLWYLTPTFVGIGVFALLLHNRAQTQEALFPTLEYHNIYVSLQTALGETLKEYLVPGHRLSTRGLSLGLILKACFFLAARYCWLSSNIKKPRRQVLIVFGLSLIATTYVSVTGSYYGYGGLTNPCHEEFRQCLIMIIVATMGVFSCHFSLKQRNIQTVKWLGVLFILTTLLFVAPRRWAALAHDYKNYSICIESRHKSWQSGLSEGTTMVWYSPPKGQVADTLLFFPGAYDLGAKASDDLAYSHIMQFFCKKHLEIRPYDPKQN